MSLSQAPGNQKSGSGSANKHDVVPDKPLMAIGPAFSRRDNTHRNGRAGYYPQASEFGKAHREQ